MERDFWVRVWEDGSIGFHCETPNLALVNHIDRLGLQPGARVFVPLCGKTRDIGWLLGRGYRVCGVELSALAIEHLFDDLGVTPKVTPIGGMQHRAAPGLDIFVGDIFDLDQGTLGPVDAVYDRAALVALPQGMRERYAVHLTGITGRADQLLNCCAYDQAEMDGPPFSVDAAQVRQFYGAEYELTLLMRKAMPQKLKGRCEAENFVWMLQGNRKS